MTAIILDTETHDANEPEVIELAYMGPLYTLMTDAGTVTHRFKPTKPISLGAMATHHIIPDDLKDCPTWPGRYDLPTGTQYIIGHNVDFDWKAIGSPNVKRICTLALARKCLPSLDSHSLSALIYHIYPPAMAREKLRNAHSAAVDVVHTNELLFSLWDVCGRPDTWEKLWLMSEVARVPTHFTFGKYGPQDGNKGMPIAEVRRMDPGYISWCLRSCDIVKNDPYWKKALTQ